MYDGVDCGLRMRGNSTTFRAQINASNEPLASQDARDY
jgi:hypothetical protein